MTVTVSNADSSSERSITSAPGSDVFPTGNQSFGPFPYVTVTGADSATESEPLGQGASGRVRRDTSFVSGVLTLTLDGVDVVEKSLTRAGYTVTGVPDGVSSGANRSGTTQEVRFDGEGGEVGSKQLGTQITSFSLNLGTLTVTVNDVDGNPVSNTGVTVEGVGQQTDENGKVTFGTSGTVTVTALRGSKSKDVDVPGGGSASVTFTFAGVTGRVRDANNRGLADATVTLKDGNGNGIAQTQTDSGGNYAITTSPVDTTVTVESEGLSRSFTSPGESQEITKNLPFDLSSVASIEVVCSDADTGEAVRATTVEMADTKALTTAEGVGRGVSLSAGEVAMTVAAGDRRYQKTRVTRTVQGGNTKEVDVTLQRAQNTPTK